MKKFLAIFFGAILGFFLHRKNRGKVDETGEKCRRKVKVFWQFLKRKKFYREKIDAGATKLKKSGEKLLSRATRKIKEINANLTEKNSKSGNSKTEKSAGKSQSNSTAKKNSPKNSVKKSPRKTS